MARRYGVSDEVLATLHDPDRCAVEEAEREALRFAAAMSEKAGEDGEAAIERLRRWYSEEQIVELACVIGLFNYLNRFAEAMGLWPTRPGEGGPAETEA